MQWVKSGIENPLKSEVIGRCGGMEKTNDHAEPTKSRSLKNKKHVGLGLNLNKYMCLQQVDHVFITI